MLPTEAVEPEAVEPAARTRSIGCQTDDLISYRDFGKLIDRKTLFCCFSLQHCYDVCTYILGG